MSQTRIAGISGLRGVVGQGLDPVVTVEFAAAYASQCQPGAVVLSHDGRISSRVFFPAMLAGVAATGRDALVAGAVSTPTVGLLVRDRNAVGGIQLSASHNPPQYNGLKFFQPRGMVLSPQEGKTVLALAEQGVRVGKLGRAGADSHAGRPRGDPSQARSRDRRRPGHTPP